MHGELGFVRSFQHRSYSFSVFNTSSQLPIMSFMQFSRNFMYELEFVLNHVTSIYITLDPPVELSYDFCGFAKSRFMFYDHFNYCHLITVGSVLFNKFKLITRAKNDLKPDFSYPASSCSRSLHENYIKMHGEALYFVHQRAIELTIKTGVYQRIIMQ